MGKERKFKFTMLDWVIPKGWPKELSFGVIIKMTHLDWDEGPVYSVRDFITGNVVRMLPRQLDKLARVP